MKYESRPFRPRSDNFVFHRVQTSRRSASIRFPSPENRRVIVECFDIVLPHMDVSNEHRKFLSYQEVAGYINRERKVFVLRLKLSFNDSHGCIAKPFPFRLR